jgi:CotS family spore coat protein
MDNVNNYNIDEYMPIDKIKNNVLCNYNFKILSVDNIKFKNTDKQRAVYKVCTDKGIKCLKKVYYDESNLLFIYSITEWLNIKNVQCPRFISTRAGHKYIKYNNDLFILTDWIEGRKCDYNNVNDIVLMARNLAKIHLTSKGFKPIDGSIIKEPEKAYYTSPVKHFSELLEFWNKAIYINDTFSHLYINNFDYNYEKAKESVSILTQFDFSLPLGDEVSKNAICHLDYVNKNIIFTPSGSLYVIDFDNSRMDMPIHDICYFLRRILKREYTTWDFNIFQKAINSYENIRPLSKREYIVIYAILMFPQKFWKVSRDYYKNRRTSNIKPFINMMNKLSTQKDAHSDFCDKLNLFIKKKYKE